MSSCLLRQSWKMEYSEVRILILPAYMPTALSVHVFHAWLFHVNAGAVPEARGVLHWNKALVLSFQVWPCF